MLYIPVRCTDKVNWSWIPGDARTNPAGFPDRAARKDERVRNNDRKLYILDKFLSSRSAIWCIILFLSVLHLLQN
jgi:hypothetical protein